MFALRMGMQFSRATAVVLLSYFGGCVFVLWVVGDAFGHDDEAAYINGASQMTALTAPSPGTVSGTVAVSLTCVAAGQPCAKVCYYVDGVLISNICPTTGPSYIFSWDSTTVIDGNHSLTAVAYSVSNLTTTSAAVVVTTSNSVTAQSYYFDSVGGADGNDCKTTVTSCKTLAKFATLKLHGGDTVNFLADDTWTQTSSVFICGPAPSMYCTQNFWPSSSTLTLTTYGTAGCNAMTGSVVGPSTPGGNSPSPAAVPPVHCATFTNSGSNSAIKLVNASNVTVQNFNLIGNHNTAGNYYGAFGIDVRTTNAAQNGLGQSSGVIVQNNYTYKYNGVGFGNTAGGTADITIGPISNYQVLDNYITAELNNTAGNQTPQSGITVAGNAQGLIQGNVIEYMSYAASQGVGISISNYPNPAAAYTTIQFNVVRYNGGNWNSGPGGPYGLYAHQSDYTLWQFNEEHHQQCWKAACVMTGNVDNGGMDFDLGTTNSIAQYNYIHDNPMDSGPGLLLIAGAIGGNNPCWTNNFVRYNILENNQTGVILSGGFPTTAGCTGLAGVYNNTFSSNVLAHDSASMPSCVYRYTGIAIYYLNNLCILTGNGTQYFDAYNYDVFQCYVIPTTGCGIYGYRNLHNYNAYWATGTGSKCWYLVNTGCPGVNSQGWTVYSQTSLSAWQAMSHNNANGLNTDPKLSGTASTGGMCWNGLSLPAGPQPCPSAYALTTSSPLIGAGVNVGSYNLPAGSQDYYGIAIPHATGTGWNIGADGSTGH